ncbi:hypothetical protein V6N11_074265 [Hibiscus sabdariffa]|uniref:Secreted protein n=1 Tax=Hibiscus sabdariffa TaxID=183260 RepID=A0ABR1ZHB2_9ROSI
MVSPSFKAFKPKPAMANMFASMCINLLYCITSTGNCSPRTGNEMPTSILVTTVLKTASSQVAKLGLATEERASIISIAPRP